MTIPTRILAFDPSINLTAAALLLVEPKKAGPGQLGPFWTIRPNGDRLSDRVRDLLDEASEVIEKAHADVIVVEMPADRPMGNRRGFQRRSVLDLPNYGAAVGAVLAAAHSCGPSHQVAPSEDRPFQLLTPSACDWTLRDVPSSANDEYKERRVRHVEALWRLKAGSLGAKTVAGNVADAMLLARWGSWRIA